MRATELARRPRPLGGRLLGRRRRRALGRRRGRAALPRLARRRRRRRSRGSRTSCSASRSTGAARSSPAASTAGVWRWDGESVDAGRRRLRVRELPGVRARRHALRLGLGQPLGRERRLHPRRRRGALARRAALHERARGHARRPLALGRRVVRAARRADRPRDRRATRRSCGSTAPCPTGSRSTTRAAWSISCYRPDRVYHLSAAGELTILAEDPQGTLLRRADERLLRGRRARPDRGREPRPLAPHRDRRHRPARRAAASAVKVRLRPERGLDVAEAWFAGRQIAWLSGRGDVAWNGDWTASWGGGLVTTCGLDNVGAPRRASACTARTARCRRATATIDDPRGLRVERTIETGDGELRLADRTTNVAEVALEAPLLYHVNLGDWARTVESDAEAVVPRDDDAEPHDPPSSPPPGDEPERVWEHVGATWARVSGSGIELEVRSNLPRMWQWIDPRLAALERRARQLLGARPRARPRRGTPPVARAGRDARDLAHDHGKGDDEMKLGLLTAAFPDLTLDEVAAWAAANGFETLEVACWPSRRRRAAPVRGRHAHRRRRVRPGRGARDARPPRPRDLVARLLPEQPPPATTRTARRSNGHLRKVIDAAQALGVEIVGTFVGNDKDRPLPENLERFREIWPPLVALRGRARREDRDRELPDDLQLRRVAGRQQPRVVAGDLGRDVRGDPRRELRPQPRPVAPRLAADRLRAGGLRLRRPDLPRAREGPRDPPRRPLPPRHVLGRHRLAGAAAAGPRRGELGRASSPRSTRSATTTCSRSSTRTGASRATRSSSKRGFLIARDDAAGRSSTSSDPSGAIARTGWPVIDAISSKWRS